jgi:surface polysaccharide O-acyltransferase-like enzyme
MGARNKRYIYLEYLRVLAMFSVIMLHITSKACSVVEEGGIAWQIYNFVRCFSAWGVNVFLMISGTLLLQPAKEYSISKIWKQYILKTAIILLFWSFLYVFIPVVQELSQGESFEQVQWDTTIKNFVLGNYHLWYLYMLIGIYVILPLLRSMLGTQENIKYFIVLSLICTVIVPILSQFENLELLVSLLDMFHISFVTGYVFLFVCGYFLSQQENKKIVIPLSAIACIITILLNVIMTSKNNGSYFLSTGVFSLGQVVISMTIFLFVKNVVEMREKHYYIDDVIVKVSKYSLGIYLVHAFFVQSVTLKCIEKFEPGFDIFVAFSVVLVASYIIIYSVKKMPKLGKHIC